MVRYIKLLIIFLFVNVSATAYANSESFFIVFTGEENGSIEPCGCFDGQIGGIVRKDTLINSLKKEKSKVFLLSFGDLIKNSSRQEEIKLEYIYHSMEEMNYMLHNLGEKDLEIGPNLTNYLSQTYKIDILSSNIKFVAPFDVQLKPYILKEFVGSDKTFNIVFLGILSKSLSGDFANNYIRISEPVKELKPLIKLLCNKADLIVLLSHASLEESVEIAKTFPEIGLIITGHDCDDPTELVTYVNDIPIVSAGRGGKYVGIAKYSIRNKIIRNTAIDVVSLDKTYSDSKKMQLLLQEYQQKLKDEDLLGKISQATLPEGLRYVGNSVCGMCHKTIYEHWENTSHGKSFTTLINSGRQYDPECVKCHTTGYGYVSGFLKIEQDRHLMNVGCESCHDAGSRHVKNVTLAYDSAVQKGCLICHDSEHSPKFQFDEYWKKIEHPVEVLQK